MSKASREFLYGLNPCFEALRAGRRSVYNAFINDATRDSPRLQKLVSLLEKRDVTVEYVDKGRLQQLCGSHEHQGAVLRTGTYPTRRSSRSLNCRTCYCSTTWKTRTTWARSSAAPRSSASVASSSRSRAFRRFYPSVVKVSAGAAEFMQIARDRNANQYVKEAIERGYTVLSLDAKGSTPLHALPDLSEGKVLLVVGGEDKAVGSSSSTSSHHVVRIEQEGQVNSLNASVAAGVALYALSHRAGTSRARVLRPRPGSVCSRRADPGRESLESVARVAV
jgi:23S rRNA (guanosine2251-2'-O)-methyltransferase